MAISEGKLSSFLIFAELWEKWKNTNGVNWEASDHSSLQEQFEIYLGKAEAMFAANGLINLGQYRWERALLSIGDYLLPRGQNISFLDNSSTGQASWKRLLRGTGPKVPKARRLLQQLLDRLDRLIADDSLSAQLDVIIGGAKGLEPWRQAFIDTPKAFQYCEKREIRKTLNEIYLLKKRQMNGAHVELFTYCLFHNELLPMASDVGFHPLELSEQYCQANATDIEPGIQFLWSHDVDSLTFAVEWNDYFFIIFVRKSRLEGLPAIR